VIYLDTSALLKLVHPEPQTDALRRFLRAQTRMPKVTSAVACAELIRAVRRVNHEQPDAGLLDAELEQAGRLIATLRLVEVSRPLLTHAGAVGRPYLRTLDAIHCASAVRLAAGLAAFVTYDKRLAQAAEEAGLPVTSPG
jgi:uncharacterized protein